MTEAPPTFPLPAAIRWKARIEYDGTPFSGWQRQKDNHSIQEAIENAIHGFSGETITIHAAGRTDAGVHAKGQVISFDLAKDTDADTIRDAVNAHLRPQPIALVTVEKAPPDFHARYAALARAYRYRILNRRAPAVLARHQLWHLPKPLAVAAMQEAADSVLGTHDFSTFRSSECQAKSPVKTLDLLRVTAAGDEIIIEARARSFLHHMVRNLVGTLAKIGTGSWPIAAMAEALAARDRRAGGPTAPAQGLTLIGVAYNKEEIDRLLSV